MFYLEFLLASERSSVRQLSLGTSFPCDAWKYEIVFKSSCKLQRCFLRKHELFVNFLTPRSELFYSYKYLGQAIGGNNLETLIDNQIVFRKRNVAILSRRCSCVCLCDLV
jgi:hypothetical protein